MKYFLFCAKKTIKTLTFFPVMQTLILQNLLGGSQDYSVLFPRVGRKQEQRKEPR